MVVTANLQRNYTIYTILQLDFKYPLLAQKLLVFIKETPIFTASIRQI